MEEAVGESVVLQATDRGRRAAALVGEDVVPLEDLVEDDPVDEATEADPQQEGRQERRAVATAVDAGQLPAFGGSISSISVTGPSLISATPMQAPKTPFSAPSRSQKRS